MFYRHLHIYRYTFILWTESYDILRAHLDTKDYCLIKNEVRLLKP